jgi:hypothetical protein
VSCNYWHQEAPDYWLCLMWDVVLEYGAWRARLYYTSRAVNREFRTAEAAMTWCDHAKDWEIV